MSYSIHQGVTVGGNVVNSQIGHTLTNCQNMVSQMAQTSQVKPLLETLQKEVTTLLDQLPEEKKQAVAEDLELLTKTATSTQPNRKWYSVSAEGLLEASKFTKEFSGNIAGTLASLGKALFGGE